MTLEEDFYEKKVFDDRSVFEEMLESAGIPYSFDLRWNAIRVKGKTGDAAVSFLFDNNGSMYSLPDDKVEEWKADHDAMTQGSAPPLPPRKHYVYEPEEETLGVKP